MQFQMGKFSCVLGKRTFTARDVLRNVLNTPDEDSDDDIDLSVKPVEKPIAKAIKKRIAKPISKPVKSFYGNKSREIVVNGSDVEDNDATGIDETNEPDEIDQVLNRENPIDEEGEIDPNDTQDDVVSSAKLVWRNRSFIKPVSNWLHDNSAAEASKATNNCSPTQILSKYFSDDLFQLIAEETNNRYLIRHGILLKITTAEIKQFFGICCIMGNLKFPRLRMYWQASYRIPLIADTMPQRRFLLIYANLAVTSNEMPPANNINKYWKVQPIVDAIRSACRSLPHEEHNSIDEQMIPFHGRVPARQYVKGKPNPVGIKSFVRCGKSGKAYDFELYQGKGTGVSQDFKHLGLGGSVVMRLVENLPKNERFKVYFDNYFTSIPLLLELKAIGFHALGVVKANRMNGAVLKSKKVIQKEGRGAFDSRVSRDGSVTLVRWNDNSVVTVASTFVGVGEIGQVKRWSGSVKDFVDVQRPEAIKVYNEYMGGVDLMDFLISLYPVDYRTKRWPTRVIMHLFDMAIVNSWLEYREREVLKHIRKKYILDLMAFREDIANTLCKAELDQTRPRGRPSLVSLLNYIPVPEKKTPPAVKPTNDIRYDGFDHWPIPEDLKNAQRCVMEGCNGKSRVRCEKCNIYLCSNKDRNCFKDYHKHQ